MGEYYRRLTTKDQTTGQLYEVEIPEDSELLDWNKPLSEQPAGVRKAVQDAMAGTNFAEPKTGKDAYKFIAMRNARRFGLANATNEDKAGSLALLEAGVKGIKYVGKSAFDRGTTGPANYVIFDGADAESQ